MTVYAYNRTISANIGLTSLVFTTPNYINYSRAGKYGYKSSISATTPVAYSPITYNAYYIFYQRIQKYIGYSKNIFLM